MVVEGAQALVHSGEQFPTNSVSLAFSLLLMVVEVEPRPWCMLGNISPPSPTPAASQEALETALLTRLTPAVLMQPGHALGSLSVSVACLTQDCKLCGLRQPGESLGCKAGKHRVTQRTLPHLFLLLAADCLWDSSQFAFTLRCRSSWYLSSRVCFP